MLIRENLSLVDALASMQQFDVTNGNPPRVRREQRLTHLRDVIVLMQGWAINLARGPI